MALRDFADGAGRQWRVWDVTAEAIHPATRGEDYMRDYLEGWLAFESADGLAKCRLTPIPHNWASASVPDLEQWLRDAQSVRGERSSGAHGRASAEVASHPHLSVDMRAPVRTFRFPGGRFWTVTECAATALAGPNEVAPHRVLRFMSGARALDVSSWPGDWASLPDEELAELLAGSFPRHSAESEDVAHRRRGDAEQR